MSETYTQWHNWYMCHTAAELRDIATYDVKGVAKLPKRATKAEIVKAILAAQI